MYVRGYFKLHQIPTALSGSLLLALSLGAGIAYTSVHASYRRRNVTLAPWRNASQPDADGFPARTALSALYVLNCMAVGVAIFHAGVFPLYKRTSKIRYWDKWQDALATFGWSFLSLHHVANALMLAMLVGGLPWASGLGPALLLLPASHLLLRLLPSLPPSLHFHMGLYVDLATHIPLALLYMWRAYVLRAPWELLGTAAEVLHLSSVIPEGILHMRRKEPTDQFSPSWCDPWGSASKEHLQDNAGDAHEEHTSSPTSSGTTHRSDRHTPEPRNRHVVHETATAATATDITPQGSMDSIGARVRARHRRDHVAAAPAGPYEVSPTASGQPRSGGKWSSGKVAPQVASPSGTTSTRVYDVPGGLHVSELEDSATPGMRAAGGVLPHFSVMEPPTEEAEEQLLHEELHPAAAVAAPGTGLKPKKSRGTGLLGSVAAKRIPVYPLLILINMASFFCFGGLIAITSAPPPEIVLAARDVTAAKAADAAHDIAAGVTAVPRAAQHAASDALHGMHMAYRVGHSAYEVKHAADRLKYDVAKAALHGAGAGMVHAGKYVGEHTWQAAQHAGQQLKDAAQHAGHAAGEHLQEAAHAVRQQAASQQQQPQQRHASAHTLHTHGQGADTAHVHPVRA